MKPFIDPAFWSDPDIESSKAGVKLAALWLITNSQTSLLGLCGASSSRFEFETGLKSEALESALQALPRAFKRFGSVIFVRNYIRHQFGAGDKLVRNNFFVALKSLFLNVKDDELKAFILSEYPELEQALTKPLQRAYEAQGKGREGKEGKAKKGSAEGKQSKAKATQEEVAEFIAEVGLPSTDAEWFFHKCEGCGWTNGGKPMKDWKATIRSWKAANYMPSQKPSMGRNGHEAKPESKPMVPTMDQWRAFIGSHESTAAMEFPHFETAPTFLKDEWRKQAK